MAKTRDTEERLREAAGGGRDLWAAWSCNLLPNTRKPSKAFKRGNVKGRFELPDHSSCSVESYWEGQRHGRCTEVGQAAFGRAHVQNDGRGGQ